MQKLFDFALKSGIVVAFGAVCSVILFNIFEVEPGSAFYFLVFFSTVFIYSSHRCIKFWKGDYESDSVFYSWISTNTAALGIQILICLAAISIIAIELRFRQILWLLFPALVAILYTLPLSIRKKDGSLRDRPYMKAWLVAAIWAYVTSIYPLVFEKAKIEFTSYVFFFARFLFFYIVTSIGDIRDVKLDSKNLRTLPQIFGLKKSIRVLQTLCFIGLAADGFYYYLLPYNVWQLLSLIFGFVLLLISLGLVKGKSSENFFSLGVDGILIWQSIPYLISLLF